MLRQAAFGVGLIAALSAVLNALVLVSPLYMLQVFDRVLLTFRVETLLYLSLIAGGCIIVLGIFEWLRGVAVARLGRWWDETVRADLLDAALAAARVKGPGVASAFQDLQQVRNFVGSASMLPFFDAPWTPFFLALIFLLGPALGVLALGSAVVLFAFAVASDIVSRRASAGMAQRQSENLAFANAALRNADVVHAMGMRSAVTRRHEERQLVINRTNQKAAEQLALISGASKAVRIGVQIAVLGVGAWLVTRGELTSGGMIAASVILGRALAPIEQAIGSWRSFTAAREAHQRIQTLLKAVPPAAEPTALPAPLGHLAVDNVGFALPGQTKRTLQRVSFRLDPGTVMALVGPSAAGKSTLCRLLVGSWRPTDGNIRLDGADLSQRRSDDRFRHIGYVPQGIELFGGTVRDNIARLGEATDEMVVEAANRAGCHQMILGLPKGYETEIGDGGAFLSGGQRQRIALARALFGDPKLIILDEPNSNLDQEGENALIAALGDAKQKGTTIVLVSHRLTMMRVVDVIGLMRNGTLETVGPRDEMLRQLQGAPRLAQPAAPVAELPSARGAVGQ